MIGSLIVVMIAVVDIVAGQQVAQHPYHDDHNQYHKPRKHKIAAKERGTKKKYGGERSPINPKDDHKVSSSVETVEIPSSGRPTTSKTTNSENNTTKNSYSRPMKGATTNSNNMGRVKELDIGTEGEFGRPMDGKEKHIGQDSPLIAKNAAAIFIASTKEYIGTNHDGDDVVEDHGTAATTSSGDRSDGKEEDKSNSSKKKVNQIQIEATSRSYLRGMLG